MSTFEKIIIPFIDDSLKSIDFTSVNGFIDCYTEDPDSPSSDKEFFLMVKADKRNSFTEDFAKRMANSKQIKREKVKYINNEAYYIYSFWVNNTIAKMYNGIVVLSPEQKARILQFWGALDDITKLVLSESVLSLDVAHAMPLEDYRERSFDINGLIIKKGGVR